MAQIFQLPTPIPAMQGVGPVFKFMVVGDNLTAVTTAGYLNSVQLQGFPVSAGDVLQVRYSFDPQNPNANPTNVATCIVTISNGVITLVEDISEGNVVLPTTANHIATYVGTNGQLTQDPANAITGGNLTVSGVISTGSGTVQGEVIMYTGQSNKGALVIAATPNAGNTNVSITNAAMGQASVITIPDPGAATAKVALAPAALVNNNLVKASGTTGLVADAGISANSLVVSTGGGVIIDGKSINIASGGTGAGPYTFTITGANTTDILLASINNTSNPVSIVKSIISSATTGSITFSGNPGATVVIDYVVFVP